MRGPQFSDYASEQDSENEIWFQFWLALRDHRLHDAADLFRSDRRTAGSEDGLKRPPVEYYRMLYADTALNGDVAPTRCGHAFFGTAKCLFATDVPLDSEQGRGLIANTITAVNALEIS